VHTAARTCFCRYARVCLMNMGGHLSAMGFRPLT